MALAELSEQRLPVVGITIGDAAGIGPEISLKAVADDEVRGHCTPVLIGDGAFLQKAAAELELDLEFAPIDDPDPDNGKKIKIFDTANLPENIRIGHDDAVTGKAAAECIQAAVELCTLSKI